MGKTPSNKENIRVVCRIRPQNNLEKERNGKLCVRLNNSPDSKICQSVSVSSDDGTLNSFAFDRIFGMDSNQEEVFLDSTAPLIESVLNGYNATIFA